MKFGIDGIVDNTVSADTAYEDLHNMLTKAGFRITGLIVTEE